jgi:hypothetical protein
MNPPANPPDGLDPQDWYFPVKTVPERLAMLEERVKNIRDDVADIKKSVDEVRDIILQGKGAKWALLGMVGIVSSFLSIMAHKLFPFLK